MGALLVSFVIGSIIGVPFLGYHLLRTRRQLNELRAELRQRGLIAPAPGSASAQLDNAPPVPLPAHGTPGRRGLERRAAGERHAGCSSRDRRSERSLHREAVARRLGRIMSYIHQDMDPIRGVRCPTDLRPKGHPV
jgi:hypothetical protein